MRWSGGPNTIREAKARGTAKQFKVVVLLDGLLEASHFFSVERLAAQVLFLLLDCSKVSRKSSS
jgi:hypothetical protein